MFYLFILLLLVLVILTLMYEPRLDQPRAKVVNKVKAWSDKMQKTYEDYQSPESKAARRFKFD